MLFYCRECHASLATEHRFCPQCGQAVYVKRTSSFWIHIGWGVFSCLSIAIILGAWLIQETIEEGLPQTQIQKNVIKKDIEGLRWPSVHVQISSGDAYAHSLGVESSFEIQPIELTVALVSAMEGELSGQWTPQELSVQEVLTIADKLSIHDGLSPCYSEGLSNCNGWRIPSYGEWMFAAHGGQKTIYSGSDLLADVSGPRTEVGAYAANAFGMYDMSGSFKEIISTDNGFGILGDTYPLSRQIVTSISSQDKRIRGVGARLVRHTS
jgi:hypothetical protein